MIKIYKIYYFCPAKILQELLKPLLGLSFPSPLERG